MREQKLMKSKRVLFVVGAVALAMAPVLASAVAATQSTTINATIASVISMTTSSTVAIAITPTSAGSASSASDTVTVNTNNTTGYNLKLSDSDTTLTLAGPSAATIAAHTGTFASPTTLANNSWGYRIDGSGTFGSGPTSAQTNQTSLSGTWSGLVSSASPTTVKTTATVASNDVTTVWYGVQVDTTKPNGVYTDSVTYTATTNP